MLKRDYVNIFIHFDDYIDKLSLKEMKTMLDEMYDNDYKFDYENCIDAYLNLLIKKYGMKSIYILGDKLSFDSLYSILRDNIDGFNYAKYFEDLISYGRKDFLINNVQRFLSSKHPTTIIDSKIIKLLKENDEKTYNVLYKDFIKSLILVKKYSDITFNMIVIMLEEIMENENVDISDIEFLGYGSYSTAYKLGDKCIKLGAKRKTHRIPYDKRILSPLIRTYLQDEVYIEISECVDTTYEASYEEVYQVYKELRDRGKIWLDPYARNLGKLLKDNKIYFDKEIVEKSEEFGFYKNTITDEEPLKRGELVIIDTDYIYMYDQLNDELIKSYMLDNYDKFEGRYQNEKGIKK